MEDRHLNAPRLTVRAESCTQTPLSNRRRRGAPGTQGPQGRGRRGSRGSRTLWPETVGCEPPAEALAVMEQSGADGRNVGRPAPDRTPDHRNLDRRSTPPFSYLRATERLRRRFCSRGLFHAGDLHCRFAQTVGGGWPANRGSHSYPQRSQRYAVTNFLKIAILCRLCNMAVDRCLL